MSEFDYSLRSMKKSLRHQDFVDPLSKSFKDSGWIIEEGEKEKMTDEERLRDFIERSEYEHG